MNRKAKLETTKEKVELAINIVDKREDQTQKSKQNELERQSQKDLERIG